MVAARIFAGLVIPWEHTDTSIIVDCVIVEMIYDRKNAMFGKMNSGYDSEDF